jgi:hypothetical protein
MLAVYAAQSAHVLLARRQLPDGDGGADGDGENGESYFRRDSEQLSRPMVARKLDSDSEGRLRADLGKVPGLKPALGARTLRAHAHAPAGLCRPRPKWRSCANPSHARQAPPRLLRPALPAQPLGLSHLPQCCG